MADIFQTAVVLGMDGDNEIILAGARSGCALSSVQGELNALKEVLLCCLERKMYLQNIYMDCACVVDWIHKDELPVTWCAIDQILEIRQLLS